MCGKNKVTVIITSTIQEIVMNINIISKSGIIPEYKTTDSAGFDLQAYLDEPIELKPMERKLIPTGIFIELPSGYEAQVRARSGLSINHGITLINAVGTIDADYRGELKVPLVNLGQETYKIKNGDRIAQVVISKFEQVQFKLVDALSDTERGSGGFGHTGV